MRVQERRRPIVEMNLIPLIDISLILVIIFMVLTPALIQSQISVKLPKSSQGVPAETEATIQIQISRDGVILIDGDPVKGGRLEKELAGKLGSASKKSVLIQADRTVPIEKVVAILDIAKKLGVGKLGIGVTPNG
ncbi:MAG: biopolymer transporter ExbD [Elusimicrobia bacterium]|nr:biopolymer transporter ExbD [Elusimicrobiota bacterium]